MTTVNIVKLAQNKVEANKPLVSINSKLDESVKQFILSFNRKDASTKDVFINLLNVFRTNKDNNDTILALGKLYNSYTNNTTIVKRLKAISLLAKEAYTTKLVIKLDLAYFYNIEETLKLMSVVNEEQATIVRKALFECYVKEDTMVSYNNKVSSKISELRRTFNVHDFDGKAFISTIKGRIDKLSTEEKKELIAYINQSLVK